MGRHSTYTQIIADEICERLSAGEPLAQICRDENMPAASTISDWKTSHPSFSVMFARARDAGYDVIAESCLQIADDSRNDFISAESEKTGVKYDAEHVQRSKLRVETRLKLLAKWDPKRYGEKIAIGGASDLPPISVMSDADLVAKIAQLQRSNDDAE